jgi:hypothetical protein
VFELNVVPILDRVLTIARPDAREGDVGESKQIVTILVIYDNNLVERTPDVLAVRVQVSSRFLMYKAHRTQRLFTTHLPSLGDLRESHHWMLLIGPKVSGEQYRMKPIAITVVDLQIRK